MALVFGKDVTLWRGDTTTEGETNFTEVPQQRGSFPFMGGTAEVKDVTTRETVGRFRAKASGLADFDTVDLQILYDHDDATHAGILDDYKTGDLRDYEVRFAGSAFKHGFRGSVSKFKGTAPLDDFVPVDLSVAVFSYTFDKS